MQIFIGYSMPVHVGQNSLLQCFLGRACRYQYASAQGVPEYQEHAPQLD